MRKRLSKILLLKAGAVVLFAGVMTYFLFNAFAASSATMYTSPGGTKSVTKGQTFNVSVRISTASGVPVTGATVLLTYPSDKLQVTGESYSGSAYSTQLLASNAGGVLRMDRAAFPAISGGDKLFANVGFKAVGTGAAAIGFRSDSIVTSGTDDSNLLSTRNGLSVNISAPAPPPTDSGSSGGSTSSGSTSGGSSGATSSGSSSSGDSGSTSSGSSSGGSTSSGGTSSGGSTSSGASSSGSTSSSGGNGGSGGTSSTGGTDSSQAEIAENTSTVEITVVDSSNKPVANAEVTLGNQTVKTDSKGVAHFENVPAGDVPVIVKYNGKKTSQNVQVKNGRAESPQLVKVSITRNKFNPLLVFVPLAALLIIGVVFMHPWDRWLTPAFAKNETPPIVTSEHPAKVDTPIAHAPLQQDPPSQAGPVVIAPPAVPPAEPGGGSHPTEPKSGAEPGHPYLSQHKIETPGTTFEPTSGDQGPDGTKPPSDEKPAS